MGSESPHGPCFELFQITCPIGYHDGAWLGDRLVPLYGISYTHSSLMQLKNQWGQCPLKIDNRANEISFWLKCESFRVTQCCNFRVQLVSLTQVSRLSA